MDPHDISACLALLALPGGNGAAMVRALRTVRSPQELLACGPDYLQTLGFRPELASAVLALGGRPGARAEQVCQAMLRSGAQALYVHDASYPAQLRDAPGPPPVLFVHGSPDALSVPSVAIVGSRKPTAAGREFAADIAEALTTYGLAIVSGLAIGIDTAAHQGALSGKGRTVAVLGSALDRVYPTRNTGLAQQIVASGGAVVSEFPPGTPPDGIHFPRRNRIVSGLSLGVLIVEAGLPSGSLLTAQHAVEQGREVMAVPGSVRSLVSRGCHELLRNGAALIETAEDVIRALGDRFAPPAVAPLRAARHTGGQPELSGAAAQVLAALGFEETAIDVVIERTGLGAAAVGAELVNLELLGLVNAGLRGYARR